MAILIGILIGLNWDRIKIALAVFILLIGAWLYPLAALLIMFAAAAVGMTVRYGLRRRNQRQTRRPDWRV